MTNNQIKQTISAKVSAELKRKVKEEASKKGVNLSEHVSSILSIDWSAKEEHYQLKLNDLKDQLKVKDDLINRLTEAIEREQKLVDQQQQLQLQSQQRVQELEQKQQLLIESATSRKWWKFWHSGDSYNG